MYYPRVLVQGKLVGMETIAKTWGFPLLVNRKAFTAFDKFSYIPYTLYISYILYIFAEKQIIMNTVSLPRKKKLIELPEDTLKKLSIMAVSEGKSLKSFIENLLISEAKTMSDEDLYKRLMQTDPEGQENISGQEKDDFENILGV